MSISRKCLTTLTLAFAGGVAFAGILDDRDQMARFFTAPDLRHVIQMEDFKAIFMGSPFEMQQAIKKECADPAVSNRHAELCARVQALVRPDAIRLPDIP